MRYIKGAFTILALVAIAIFSVQNLEMVDLKFLSWSLSIPEFLLIVATYVLGMFTGAWLFDFLKYLFKSNSSAKSK